MTEKETKQYILSQWISEDFLASDLISNNHQQPIVYINPQFTFLEKFLKKREQRLIIKELLNQKVLSQNCVKPNTFTLDFNVLSTHNLDINFNVIEKILYKSDNGDDNDKKKALSPQTTQLIPTSFEFPEKFMDLLKSEVFNHGNSSESKSKSLWQDFAKWVCFKIGKNYLKHFDIIAIFFGLKPNAYINMSKLKINFYKKIIFMKHFLGIQKTNFILPMKQQKRS